MEFKATISGFLLLFLIVLPGPSFSKARLHVKQMGSEIYEIDYRGPETHTYIPPPNWDRPMNRPKVHHRTSMARHKSKVYKAKRNVKKMQG